MTGYFLQLFDLIIHAGDNTEVISCASIKKMKHVHLMVDAHLSVDCGVRHMWAIEASF